MEPSRVLKGYEQTRESVVRRSAPIEAARTEHVGEVSLLPFFFNFCRRGGLMLDLRKPWEEHRTVLIRLSGLEDFDRKGEQIFICRPYSCRQV